MPPTEPQATRSHPLILLVDDSEDNRELYALYLGRKGFDVAEAANGQTAIADTARIRPDLVIMDLSLPDMDGERVIHQIKSDPRNERTPIIVVSGYDLEGSRPHTWDAFLRKPCPPDSLEREIRRLLSRDSPA
jgi:CheY-like chemotaxis protein